MSLNKLVNFTAKVNFRRKFRVDLLPFLNVTLSIKRMFSNKPQLGLPKHYSFDIYSIRIPPTEAYQGQHFDFSKGVSSKTNKKWRLMELFRLPSVRRIFLRASVYKASPGACFARATGRRISRNSFRKVHFLKLQLQFKRRSGSETCLPLYLTKNVE